MNKILSLIALISLAVAFTGCAEDNMDDTSPITIVSSDIEFNPLGGEGVISFNAKAKPTVESNEEWLSIGSITDTDVTFSVGVNEGMSDRNATVTLTVGNKSQEVSVWQSGSIFNLGVLSLTLGADAEEKVLNVNTYIDNSGITANTGATWLNVTLADNKVTFKPTLNNGAERSTVVSFDLGTRTVKLDVRQLDKGYVDNYNVVIPREGSATITARSALNSVASAWTVSSDAPSWLTATRNGNVIDLDASPSPNTTGVANSTTVTITGNSQSLAVINVRYEIYSYDFYLGPWTMVYGNPTTALPVELKVNVQGESYKMALNGYDVIIGYDHSTGNLSLVAQNLGRSTDGKEVYLCPGAGGSVIWATGVGFDLVYNRNEAANEFAFTDNGVWRESTLMNFSLVGFSVMPPTSSNDMETIASYSRPNKFYR